MNQLARVRGKTNKFFSMLGHVYTVMIAFRADMKSCPVQYELKGLKTGTIRSHTSNIESLVR